MIAGRVFKTVVAGSLGQGGSIPLRLRYQAKRASERSWPRALPESTALSGPGSDTERTHEDAWCGFG